MRAGGGDASSEPGEWLVLFHRRSTRWAERLTPGRFKHVSVVGYVHSAGAWVHLSWELHRLRVNVVSDLEFDGWLAGVTGAAGAGVLRVRGPALDLDGWRPRLPCCTSLVAHALGLRRGALWPAGLWRHLRALGAEVVIDAGEERPGRAVGSGEAGGGDCEPRAA